MVSVYELNQSKTTCSGEESCTGILKSTMVILQDGADRDDIDAIIVRMEADGWKVEHKAIGCFGEVIIT